MGDFLNQITSLLGGIWDSPVVQFGLRAFAVYIVMLWLAGAYWAFRDMQLRTANPLLPYFAASLVILFTPVFFPFAIVAYRVVRPQEKIGEVYERTLAEEALLAEVEAVKSCPTCARRVNDDWIICPTCRTRLNRVCPNCSRLVGLDWSLCAWCGRDFERATPGIEGLASPKAAPAPPPVPLPTPVRQASRPAGADRSAAMTAGWDQASDRLEPRERALPAVAPSRARPLSGGPAAPRPAADPLPER